jgi:hypothetical protein
MKKNLIREYDHIRILSTVFESCSACALHVDAVRFYLPPFVYTNSEIAEEIFILNRRHLSGDYHERKCKTLFNYESGFCGRKPSPFFNKAYTEILVGGGFGPRDFPVISTIN